MVRTRARQSVLGSTLSDSYKYVIHKVKFNNYKHRKAAGAWSFFAASVFKELLHL